MSPEFRARESDIGALVYLCCLRCASDYSVAARGDCGCREANRAAGSLPAFLERIGEAPTVADAGAQS